MVGNAKRRTAADQRRFDDLKRMGCVICSEMGIGFRPAEIHHIVEARVRKGHQFTIPLCPWHHRGEPWDYDTRPSEMEATIGPSLARNKRAFVDEFGTELQILERVNRKLKEAA